MGIKTFYITHYYPPKKNSEKPPHHMGIKTSFWSFIALALVSEKPPHHMGIKTV